MRTPYKDTFLLKCPKYLRRTRKKKNRATLAFFVLAKLKFSHTNFGQKSKLLRLPPSRSLFPTQIWPKS
ncbi:hypothetical protein RchiOBHm_Chr3g0469751 [Rosa chinensis]|uniref:Uncharacterized protein n=1 Tax=Rosa chinensis TaxID=74649 RepID=A0A2P6RAW1_ROSCH|nr:hypothetical protein RchiOBHm_Chr3g0469751 [Rosa chinensis]